MKKAVLISIFIFWTFFVGIVAAGKVFQPETEEGQTTNTSQVNTASLAGVTLSTAEVAKHNTTANCWIIFSGNVYDLTSYFGGHPGGDSVISPYCGKDGSTALNGIHTHSNTAMSMLSAYLLGPVGKTFPAGSVPAVAPTTTTPKSTTVAPQSSASSSLSLTAAEVAKHNSSSSCWAILSGGVYNLTSFKGAHSGGSGTIPCGVDATSVLVNRHGSGYLSYLSPYKIGTIGQTVSTSTATSTGTTVTPPTSPNGREDD